MPELVYHFCLSFFDSFFPLVPSAAPIFTITSVTAVSFTVSWQPPPPCEQNGVITGYVISVTTEGVPFDERNVSANITSMVISSLNPFVTYSVKMAASTAVGQGVFSSEATFRTNESGILQSLQTLLCDNALLSLMQGELCM